MWTARSTPVINGRHYLLYEQETALSNQQFFQLLANRPEFAHWFNQLLAGVAAKSFFWEFPPLTAASMHSPVEFVTITAPRLARMAPDPDAFRDYFTGAQTRVAVFPNLGGDATLVVPAHLSATTVYTHLASFVRTAEADQYTRLWMQMATEVNERISDTPVWLSTSGLGIGWLHVRLDSYPKYYQYGPYRARPAGSAD